MATTTKTYYDLLGVPKNASQDEIRKAYLKLARKYHPDKTGGDKAAEEKLKEINNAYDTLKNPDKRKQYDQMMFEGPVGGAFRGFGGQGFTGTSGRPGREGFEGFGGPEGFDFSDLFSGIFGGATAETQAGPQPGEDLEAAVTVSLEEIATGTTKFIRVRHRTPCRTCHGTGAAPGSRLQTCPQCKGTGRISQGGGARFIISQQCPRCGGTGRIVTTPCPSCGGSGWTDETHTVSVRIPEGVRSGARLRLAGQGHAGEPGAPSGDLYVVVKERKDPLFEREGNNLICEAPVTFMDAALGGTVRVPTLTGQAELHIPPGTQSGNTFRLRGLGLPQMRSTKRGDLLVRVQVETPTKVSDEERRLIQNLREKAAPASYPKRHAFNEMLERRAKRR